MNCPLIAKIGSVCCISGKLGLFRRMTIAATGQQCALERCRALVEGCFRALRNKKKQDNHRFMALEIRGGQAFIPSIIRSVYGFVSCLILVSVCEME